MDAYIGEIRYFAFGFAPRGFVPCHGQLLSLYQFQALFALIGTTYGGDGRTTFAIPDLRGKSPLDRDSSESHQCICVSGIFPSRD